jgi:hypothetical protein
MRHVLDLVTTAIRITVGFVLRCVGVYSALTIHIPANADPAYVQGTIIGTVLWTVIFGFVGFKMMTRKRLPR